ncbi:MAG: rhodanese-related sulfurtransferase [Pseudomonadota bacterium]
MTSVVALYRFTPLSDLPALQADVRALGAREGLRGTLLLAPEGLNGTLAGPREGLERLMGQLRSWPGCADLEGRFSTAAEMPFARLKVRLKREIVTMGRTDVQPSDGTGRYVAPEAWNALISAPDVTVIDTRNAYEVRLGTFSGAIDPQIESFSDFPAWWEAHAERFKNQRIAMFCTGGIRCEKSTALLTAQGVSEVYHLEGGILSYLEHVPEAESQWHGECFVFDQRVALSHGLAQGTAGMCHACRRPVTPEDMASDTWEEGVSCPLCIGEYTNADRTRFRERQRQVALAARRGVRHMA